MKIPAQVTLAFLTALTLAACSSTALKDAAGMIGNAASGAAVNSAARAVGSTTEAAIGSATAPRQTTPQQSSANTMATADGGSSTAADNPGGDSTHNCRYGTYEHLGKTYCNP